MLRYVGWSAPLGALVISGVFLTGCQQQTSRLAGESLPQPNGRYSLVTKDYPAVVMIVLPGGRGICSGTFVSEKAVLTAAHCTKEDGRYQVVASFGTFSTYLRVNNGPGVVDDPNDIALLLFEDAIADRAKNQVYDMGDGVSQGDTVRLVGYGCNDIDTRTGSGTKRTGTNVVSRVGDYIEFLTPRESSGSRSIIGSENRSGSCFGDSGGPGLKVFDDELRVVGVTHAGGAFEDQQISEYTDVANRSDNRAFLREANTEYNLGIQGL